jgi:predicted phosphoribosyltransferase
LFPFSGKTLLVWGVFLIPFGKSTGYIHFRNTLLSCTGWIKKKKEGEMAMFKDRREAGRKLAQTLSPYAGRPDMLILALPRGGVPVAYEVALALSAPLDVFIVRKLGLPGQEELAIGAIASGGIRILNGDILRMLSVADEIVNFVVRREVQELQRREKLYRGERPSPEVRDRTIIIIDDGLATGASMRAAVAGLRARHPARIAVAVPVAAGAACDAIRPEVDEIVCVAMPEPFYGVSRWYEDFAQVTDDEVRILLEEANHQCLFG